MRKQKIQLAVLLAALLLFTMGFYAAKSISAREEEKEKAKEAGEYTALSFDADDLVKLEIKREEGNLELDFHEGKWSFVKDINLEMEELSSEDASEETGTETKEQNAEEKSYEVNASAADELRDTLANLTSQNEISAGEDESEYGLDKPSMTITVTLSDGAEHSVEVGSLNAVIQAYYIRVDHSDTLYTMSETDHDLLCKTDTDLAQEVSEES